VPADAPAATALNDVEPYRPKNSPRCHSHSRSPLCPHVFPSFTSNYRFRKKFIFRLLHPSDDSRNCVIRKKQQKKQRKSALIRTIHKNKDFVKFTNFRRQLWFGYSYYKNCNVGNKIVRATKMIIISRYTIVICIGTKRDCQCHIYLLLWQVIFCVYERCSVGCYV